MKIPEITIYKDAAVIRAHNRRFGFFEDGEDGFLLKFRKIAKDADSPACLHICHRGKIRETQIKLSEEALELLVVAYLKYKDNNHE